MAERRMFAKTIIDSDAFLEMPSSTQNLYFHLGMRAKNKGIINNIKSICRYLNIEYDAIDLLIDRNYLIKINDNIYEIIHWYENNGIGETARKRNNYKYRDWRKNILKRDSYKCTKCGCNIKLNVHHIKEFSKYPKLRFDLNNGITLCNECHKNLHKRIKSELV